MSMRGHTDYKKELWILIMVVKTNKPLTSRSIERGMQV
jgi:hypothetical protein